MRALVRLACGLLIASLITSCYNPAKLPWERPRVEAGTLEGDRYTSPDEVISFRVPFEPESWVYSRMRIAFHQREHNWEIIVTSHASPAEVYRLSLMRPAPGVSPQDLSLELARMPQLMTETLASEYGTPIVLIDDGPAQVGSLEAYWYLYGQHIPETLLRTFPQKSRPAFDAGHSAYLVDDDKCAVMIWINWPHWSGQKVEALPDADSAVGQRIVRFLEGFELDCG